MPGIRICFELQSAARPQGFMAFTDDDGHVTSWSSTDPQRITPIRGHIFHDKDTVKGVLKFFASDQHPQLPWREIIVQVNLNGGKSHCILLQLLGPLMHQVEHIEYTPESRPSQNRVGAWSVKEDRKLMYLRSRGWRIRQIYAAAVLPGRTESGLSSRSKLLVNRYQSELKTRARWEGRALVILPTSHCTPGS